MKGKLVYAAVISIIALLGVFENFIPFCFIFLILCCYLYYAQKISKRQFIPLILVYVLFTGVGVYAESTQKTDLSGEEISFILRFVDDVRLDGNMLAARAELHPGGEQVILRYQIGSVQEKETLKESIFPGTVCKVTGSLSRPGQSRNPNAFDYQLYLERNNIFWILDVGGIDQALCSQTQGSLLSFLKKFRQIEINKLAENLDQETAAISAALLFGDRQLMNSETEAGYEKTGTVHLLAISGLHVALLAGMCFSLLLWIGVTREKAELLLIIALPIYAVLTGLAPPVNRSVLMLMLFIASRKLRFKMSPLDVISIVFLLLVFITPFSLYDPGFQLSFGVSFGLVLSAGGILNRFNTYIAKLAVVSVIAQLSSIPIILTYFYEISLISVLANLLFVPLFSIILLPFVLIVYLLNIFAPYFSQLFLPLLDTVIGFANKMSAALASYPGVSVIIGKPSLPVLLLYISAILFLFIEWEKYERVKKRLLFILLIPFFIQLAFPYVSPYGKVVFIDVGQGDSILIRLPYNRGNYLIDTGGTIVFDREEWQERRKGFETGRDILVPYMKSEGIRKIDKLILTHGDSDHIAGASALLSELQIEEILIPPSAERSELEKKVIYEAKRKAIKTTVVGVGKRWIEGKSGFQVVSPFAKLEDKNEGSIVLWASLGGKSWLFTGDLGEAGEKLLIKNFAEMEVDILKVGHHGSKSSSSEEFLDSISPEIAVISAGAKNRYGHPHQEVLERMRDHKTIVYRTDKQGAVVYSFSDYSGTISTWIP